MAKRSQEQTLLREPSCFNSLDNSLYFSWTPYDDAMIIINNTVYIF